MATVTNQILGTFSGKLGGICFRSNQFGSHVYKAPVQKSPSGPDMSFQKKAFFSNPFPWSNVDKDVKATWNSFATKFFNNPRTTSKKGYKGYQVFKSCILTLQQMDLAIWPFDIILDSGYTRSPLFYDGIYYPNYAPSQMIIPFIGGPPGMIFPYKFTVCTLNDNTTSTFRIEYISPLTPPWHSGYLEDSNKERFGFAFYISKYYNPKSIAAVKLYRSLIAWTGYISFPAGQFDDSSIMTLTADLHTPLHARSKVKQAPLQTTVSCLMVSEYGTCCNIGNLNVPFSGNYS